ncbi:MAG: tetratricopeptide repeat protein [Rubripirellula sp.]|nr:tetratricopeptide repeat protein [Rubripirellula sp.]
MNSVPKLRQVLFTSLVVGTTVSLTGCTSGGFSLSSMNPFSKQEATINQVPGVSEAIAASDEGTNSQLASFGENAKKAFSKTTNAVTGAFRFGDDKGLEEEIVSDPLSLDNKPASVGPEVYVANGRLWESTGDNTKAMESYGKALQSAPGNPDALASIARLHLRQGNQQQAVQYFQQAITGAPEDALLYNELGLALNTAGNYQQAVAALEKSLELAPGTSKYANSLASVRFGGGDATAAYQVLLANNKPAIANYNMAYLLYSNGQVAGARDYLNQALQSQREGVADPAVKLAVDRSRSLLSQIDTKLGPVAQASPQATIARVFTDAVQPTAAPVSNPVTTSVNVGAGAPTSAAPTAAQSSGLTLPQLPSTPAVTK